MTVHKVLGVFFGWFSCLITTISESGAQQTAETSALSEPRRMEGLSEREESGEGKWSKLSVNEEETEHGTQECGNELNNEHNFLF